MDVKAVHGGCQAATCTYAHARTMGSDVNLLSEVWGARSPAVISQSEASTLSQVAPLASRSHTATRIALQRG